MQEVMSVHSQEEVRAWFQQALGVRCCLVRQRPGSRKPVPPLQPERQNDQDSSGHIGELPMHSFPPPTYPHPSTSPPPPHPLNPHPHAAIVEHITACQEGFMALVLWQ